MAGFDSPFGFLTFRLRLHIYAHNGPSRGGSTAIMTTNSDTYHPLTPPRSDDSAECSDLEEELHQIGRRRRIPCSLMRAGTSKGLFFKLEDLPEDRELWQGIITSAMGSPDPFSRQLDGMGGGQSTSSKVAIVSPSDHPDADVDYLFVQGAVLGRWNSLTTVPINGTKLDFSGNCGNMASGVGPFAVEERMVNVKNASRQSVTVRIRK